MTIEDPCPGSGTPVGAAIPTGFAESDPHKCPVCRFVVRINSASQTLRKHHSRESRTAMAKGIKLQPSLSRSSGSLPAPSVQLLESMGRYLSTWARQLQVEWLKSGTSVEQRDSRLARAWQHAASLRALVDTIAVERHGAPVEFGMKLLLDGVGVCPECNCLHVPQDPICRAKRFRYQPIVE